MLGRIIGDEIELTIALSPTSAMVKADPGQIQQIIMNLAINARDAMPHGGKLRIETAKIDLDEKFAKMHKPTIPGRYVKLSVVDTGTGMDPETQGSDFRTVLYQQKEIGKGTGLGLATVYGVVKQSGGYIWVVSSLGNGTTFDIYLPEIREARLLLSDLHRQ